jgi:hypothetical protein
LGDLMATQIKIPKVPDYILKKFRIENEVSVNRFARLLLTGPSRQGKTTIMGTASRNIVINEDESLGYNNLCYIQYDPQGSDTFIDMGVKVDKVEPRNFEELMDFIKFLHTADADQYDVVALDTYSFMQSIIGKDLIRPGQEILNGFQDFNKLYQRCRRINEELMSLKKHLIIGCHVATKDNPLQGYKAKELRDQITSVALDGKMAHLLPANFSIHATLEKVGEGQNIDVYARMNQPGSDSGTRFRTKPIFINPTFKEFLTAMHLSTRLYNNINWVHDEMGFKAQVKK